MKFSIFYLYILRIAEQEKISIDEALYRVKELGYTAIDIDVDEIKDNPSIIDKIHRFGFIIRNVYGLYNLFSDSIINANELIDYAVMCDAKVAMLLPGLFQDKQIIDILKDDDIKMQEFLRTNNSTISCLDKIKTTCEYAKKNGVCLTIESFGDKYSLTSYISQIDWLLQNVSGLYFTFDIGNFYLNNQSIEKAYNMFSTKSVHIHCKDYLESPKPNSEDFSYEKISVPVGKGKAPTNTIVRRFIKDGYNGYYTVEYLGEKDTYNVVKQSIEYLKNLVR